MSNVIQQGLSPKLYATKQFIISFIEKNGFAPNFDEMGAGLGLSSKSGVSRRLVQLKDRGHIHYTPNRNRSVVIIEASPRCCPHCKGAL